MPMSIDEAIAHAREVAEKQRKDNENCKYKAEYGCKGCADYYSKPCIECAKEQEQLAEWLEELKELRKEKDKFDRNTKFFNEINLKCFNEGYSKAENDYHAQSEKDRQSSHDFGYEAGYNKAINDMKSIVKNHNNTEKVSMVKLMNGKHNYYRAISVSKFCRLAEQLKAGGNNG